MADLLDGVVISNPPVVGEARYQKLVHDARNFAQLYFGVDILKMCQKGLPGDRHG